MRSVINSTSEPASRMPTVSRPDVIRVVLADDHLVVRAGLKALLGAAPDIDVVGEATNGRDALALIDRLAPHVAILDLDMPQRMERQIGLIIFAEDDAARSTGELATEDLLRQPVTFVREGDSVADRRSKAGEKIEGVLRAVGRRRGEQDQGLTDCHRVYA